MNAAQSDSLRILVVDDTRANRMVLKILLTRLGHFVDEASDGAEALQVAKQMLPDIIFSDIAMPVMDGYEFARAIRADDTFSKTRLIAVTGQEPSEGSHDPLQSGFDQCVWKPLDVNKIIELLDEFSRTRS